MFAEFVLLDRRPDLLLKLLHQLCRQFVVVHGGALCSAHSDRLEVLRAHHGAHPAAARKAVLVAGDAGDGHAPLAGRTNRGDAQFLVAVLGPHGVDGLLGVHSPEIGSVANLHVVVNDPQIDRSVGGALEQQHVVSGVLQRRSPTRPCGRVAERVRHGRDADHAELRPARHGRPLEGPSGEDQTIRRVVRIKVRRDLAPENLRPQTGSADESLQILFGNRLGLRRSAAKVNSQQSLPVSTAHRESSVKTGPGVLTRHVAPTAMARVPGLPTGVNRGQPIRGVNCSQN